MTINELCSLFNVEPVAIKEVPTGLINSSYIVIDKNLKRYLLQEINTNAFKDVDAVMKNIVAVTTHIRDKAIQNNTDPNRATLRVARTENGESYVCFRDSNGKKHYYRMFDFIENASTFDSADEALLYECGVGFGKFQKDLADFPAHNLRETIPNFHNTHARYTNFINLIYKLRREQNTDRIKEACPEILIAVKYGLKYSSVIVDALQTGEIPLRVVHNDTKLNNIMIDNQTHKAVCAIDLDTVMPGSMLYDYGDAIRYSANTGQEDDKDTNNVKVDLNKFKAFTRGYLSQIYDCVTDEELKLMPKSPIVISYELGLRFLTDYLENDHYFKCDPARPNHNLERARAQFKLMREFEANEHAMWSCINEIHGNLIQDEMN